MMGDMRTDTLQLELACMQSEREPRRRMHEMVAGPDAQQRKMVSGQWLLTIMAAYLRWQRSRGAARATFN